jgi:hypothetical protein
VGLVDYDEIHRPRCQSTSEIGRRELLRRREHEFNRTPSDLGAGPPDVGGRYRAVHLDGLQTERRQLLELIAHQGDQRRYDDGHPRHQHRGHLITQRLPGAGGHDRQCVLLRQHRIDDRLLTGTQSREAEHLTHQTGNAGA